MLYQEVRPKTFKDVVGNRSTVRGLQALSKREPNDRPHAILLSGPKGCGKTTLAYILASEFGTRKGNIQVLNTANVRGIDTIREIISQVAFAPIGGGTTTYILDEAHQITKDAQQALLKVLEDTPEHAYFVLCTTDPQKLLPTVKNRCSGYVVDQLGSRDILAILERASKEKGLNIDSGILEVIAQECEQTPRTALVLLEKIMDLTDLDEMADAIASEIEAKEGTDFFDFCKMLLVESKKRESMWKKILQTYEKLEQDPERTRFGLLGFLRKHLGRIEAGDLKHAKDIARTMRILSSSTTYYGGKHALTALLLEICLGESQ